MALFLTILCLVSGNHVFADTMHSKIIKKFITVNSVQVSRTFPRIVPKVIPLPDKYFDIKTQKKLINTDAILSIFPLSRRHSSSLIVRVANENIYEYPRIDFTEEDFETLFIQLQQALNNDESNEAINGFILLHPTTFEESFLLNIDYIQSITETEEGTLITTKIDRALQKANPFVMLPRPIDIQITKKQPHNVYYVHESLDEIEDLLRLARS